MPKFYKKSVQFEPNEILKFFNKLIESVFGTDFVFQTNTENKILNNAFINPENELSDNNAFVNPENELSDKDSDSSTESTNDNIESTANTSVSTKKIEFDLNSLPKLLNGE